MALSTWIPLLLIPPTLLAIVRMVRAKDWFPARRRRALAALSLAATALLVALCGPTVEVRSGVSPTVIFVADASGSMAGGKPWPTVAQWVRSQLPADVRMGIVVFSGAAQVSVAPGQTLPTATDLGRRQPAGAVTNIEQAIRSAIALSTDPSRTALLVYSDGYETEGRAEALRRGIRVYCLPAAKVTEPPPANVAIADLQYPERLEPGQRGTVRAAVVSTTKTMVTVRLAGGRPPPGGRAAEPIDLALEAGLKRWVEFPLQLAEAGLIRARVVVSPSGDDLVAEDNFWPFAVQVGRRRPLLVVTYQGEGRRGDMAAVAIPPAIPKEVIRAAQMPAEAAALGDYSAVLLVDVPAHALSSRTLAALVQYVGDMGGALVALGGENSFGLGGYGKSRLDTLLPVKSDPQDRPPIQLVVVLDRSASMAAEVGGVSKLLLAQEAVLQIARFLNESDRVGLVAFNHEFETVAEAVGTRHWESLRRPLMKLQARGGTEMGPALEAALGMLSRRPTRTGGGKEIRRHVIVVSDGRSKPFDIEAVVAEAKRLKVTISAVSTAAAGAWPGLEKLSSGTGGKFYDVAAGLITPSGSNRLARVFLEDLPLPILQDKPSRVTVGDRRPILPAGPGRLAFPDLPQHLITEPKGRATIHLWAETVEAEKASGPGRRKRPILATWRYGLGKAVAWPIPWTSANGSWLRSPAVARAFARSLDWAGSASPLAADYEVSVSADGGRLRAKVAARKLATEPAPMERLRLSLSADDAAEATSFDLTATGPGLWRLERSIPPGIYAYYLSAGDNGSRQGVQRGRLSTGPAAEYRRLGIDRDRLSHIAITGGGWVLDSPVAAREITVASTRPSQLWPELTALAGLLVLYEAMRTLLARPR
ncbi:MAG: VWA domain-containing protein [Anaerolineaceae bacterium]|nr:VWA domain-containing protein [Anaerolineaceae bacterium]